jgi:class 3 adenylate cyclase
MNMGLKRLLVGAISLGMVGVSLTALRSLSAHRAERMDAEMMSMTAVLADQVRGELEHFFHRIAEIAERPTPETSLTEADYDILSIAVWEKPAGSAQYGRISLIGHGATPAVPEEQASFEQKIVNQGFKGRSMILLDHSIGVIALPIGAGSAQRVAVARFRLAPFQRAFRSTGSMESFLIGTGGEIFAHQNAEKVGTVSPIAQKVFAESGGARSGDFNLSEGVGRSEVEKHYTFKLISQGQLAVVTALASAEAGLSAQELCVFWGMIALFIVAAVLLVLSSKAKPKTNTSEAAVFAESPVSKKLVAVLHVLLLPQDPAFEKVPGDEAVKVLNDFFEIASSIVKNSQAVMERASGGSFVVSWEDPMQAIRCALGLRQEYFRQSESQKLEGLAPVSVVMGMDWGMGLVACVGPEGGRVKTTLGDVLANARSLAHLAPTVETDLLASQSFWDQIAPGFVGEQAAEAHLTSSSGLTSCYRVKGYRDSEGKSVLMHIPSQFPPLAGSEPKLQGLTPQPSRWMVNNGTQIVGPFSAKEVAARLYSMDLDFDCECWSEGAGVRKTIAQNGVFGQPGDADANLWIYDGETMHGPMSEGFLRTAMQHGAFQKDALICAATTVAGWRNISDYLLATAPQDLPVAA